MYQGNICYRCHVAIYIINRCVCVYLRYMYIVFTSSAHCIRVPHYSILDDLNFARLDIAMSVSSKHSFFVLEILKHHVAANLIN